MRDNDPLWPALRKPHGEGYQIVECLPDDDELSPVETRGLNSWVVLVLTMIIVVIIGLITLPVIRSGATVIQTAL